MMRVACVVLAFAAATSAAAQQRGGALCKDGAMPFSAAADNRLSGPALQQALAGRKLGYLRESLRTPGVWVNNARELRSDGSLVYACEFSRSPSGPWSPCTSFGSTAKQAAGARDVGVWAIRNDTLCMTGAAFGESSESCFAIHRQGAATAAKRVSGPPSVCIEGAITLQ